MAGRSKTSIIVILNSCLKLLKVQCGPGMVKRICNNRGIGVDTINTFGFREEKYCIILLERLSAVQIDTPSMYFGTDSMS